MQCPANLEIEARYIFELGYSIYEWGAVVDELANRIAYGYFEAGNNSDEE